MNASFSQVSPLALRDRLNAGDAPPLLLDVRTPMEYRERHLEAARLIPLDQLDAAALAREEAAGREVVLICRSGNRACQAAGKLAAAGLRDVGVLEGGMLAWEAAGLPVNRGPKGISLERQVRIAAGLLVLAGVILGMTIHPGFYLLSAFIGAGLVFAGVTDWCGMGLLLAKAPWNHHSGGPACPVNH